MTDLGQFREVVAAMMANQASIEEVLAFLRDRGCSKLDSVWALEDFAAMSHLDAKRAVHESRAWADRKASDDALHEQVEEDLGRALRQAPDSKSDMP